MRPLHSIVRPLINLRALALLVGIALALLATGCATSPLKNWAVTFWADCAASGGHVEVSHERTCVPGTPLSWATVPLKGMHLRLESPKSKRQIEDLRFGDGTLAVSVCKNDACTYPLTIWKIENNRLKTGFAPSEGDVLVAYTTDRVIMRTPDGQVRIYSIVNAPRP